MSTVNFMRLYDGRSLGKAQISISPKGAPRAPKIQPVTRILKRKKNQLHVTWIYESARLSLRCELVSVHPKWVIVIAGAVGV